MATEVELLQDLMLLVRAAQLVLQEETLEGISDADVSPTKMNVLRLLRRQRRQSVNDLARFLGQTKAAASQNVDSLVNSGLVRRDQDKADRRCVWVSLTPRGSRILEKAEAMQLDLLRKTVSGLPKASVAKLSRGMRALAVALLGHSPKETASCLQCCAYNSVGCVCEHDDWRCVYASGGALSSVES